MEYTVDVTPGDYDIMLYYFCEVDNSTEIEISLDGDVFDGCGDGPARRTFGVSTGAGT